MERRHWSYVSHYCWQNEFHYDAFRYESKCSHLPYTSSAPLRRFFHANIDLNRYRFSFHQENVYIFVDFANLYKDAKKEWKKESARLHTTESTTTNEAPPPPTPPPTLERALVKFTRNLRKYHNTGLAVEQGLNDLWEILSFVRDDEVWLVIRKTHFSWTLSSFDFCIF